MWLQPRGREEMGTDDMRGAQHETVCNKELHCRLSAMELRTERGQVGVGLSGKVPDQGPQGG